MNIHRNPFQNLSRWRQPIQKRKGNPVTRCKSSASNDTAGRPNRGKIRNKHRGGVEREVRPAPFPSRARVPSPSPTATRFSCPNKAPVMHTLPRIRFLLSCT
ncbi:hypothetical protein CDAR_580561 [Caerostris darwini]|uniref:Uncharacterized protein n=1 Tax=Caerostris darwini TaxID=1538125 RepID=A0AAV4R587_9ARAC|nr:hypothetical protein CDAR_580561 [Caerostris darwini]